MLVRGLVASCALVLATIAAQTGILDSDAQSSPSDSAPSIESHHVLTGACAGGDLHVMRYDPVEDPDPLVATWCAPDPRSKGTK